MFFHRLGISLLIQNIIEKIANFGDTHSTVFITHEFLRVQILNTKNYKHACKHICFFF